MQDGTLEVTRQGMMAVDGPKASTSAGASVLVMDDNADFVEFITEVVELCGHTPTAVTQSSDFKQVCAAVKPRVVIMDIHMPGLDGMHLTQWLGELAYANNMEIRLIIVSGRGEDVIQLCKSVAAMSGFSDVHAYNKPIEIATLTKALDGLGSRPPGQGKVK